MALADQPVYLLELLYKHVRLDGTLDMEIEGGQMACSRSNITPIICYKIGLPVSNDLDTLGIRKFCFIKKLAARSVILTSENFRKGGNSYVSWCCFMSKY